MRDNLPNDSPICLNQLKKLQAIILIYLALNDGQLDEETNSNLLACSDLLCFLSKHSCIPAKEVKQRFIDMKQEIVTAGIDLDEAVLFVERMEKLAEDKHVS